MKKDKIIQAWVKNPTAKLEEIAEIAGCSTSHAHRHKPGTIQSQTSGHETKVSETIEGENKAIVTTSSEIRTLEQLLLYCAVDLKTWEVSKSVVNSWGSATNECFQVKAWLRLRDEPALDEIVDEFRNAVKGYTPDIPSISHKVFRSGNALEISIHDLHFGSLSWAPETGANYDIKIAKEIYIAAIEDLINHAMQYNPEKIVMPVGSDFFNVNSRLNITVNNTLQDEDARWIKTFVYGRKMVIHAIEMLRQLAPVEIKMIPGNHDAERYFFLGDSLDSWYRNCDSVTVDNSPKTRKYWKWGNSLVGFTHGKDEVKGTLPMIMATEVPELWAGAKFKEFHTGHLHSANSASHTYKTENQGVRVKVLGALCATDSWHASKGYSGLREAQGFIWNDKNGNIATFYYHP